MKTRNTIELISALFVLWSFCLALIAAGCWMMYHGWHGCGLTTIIIGAVFFGCAEIQNEDDDL